MKTYQLEVKAIGEFQGYQTISYSSKGHHLIDLFLSQLESEYAVTCDLSKIKHEYWRNVPQGNEGMICIRCNPGKGAYPVTTVDVDDVNKILKQKTA